MEKINIFEIGETREGATLSPMGFLTRANKFTEKGNIVFLYYPPGTKNQLHSHDDLETIYYIASGEGLITIGEEKEMVKTGDVVFTPRNTKHQVANEGKETLIILEVAIKIPK